MNIKKKLILSSLGLSLVLTGCSDLVVQMKKQLKNKQQYKNKSKLTREGYELDNGEKTDKIAEVNREEIDGAVKAFFRGTYKTEVKVHNVVSAVDGATVFVESVGYRIFIRMRLYRLKEIKC